jgi:hypothetical protein
MVSSSTAAISSAGSSAAGSSAAGSSAAGSSAAGSSAAGTSVAGSLPPQATNARAKISKNDKSIFFDICKSPSNSLTFESY